MNTIIVSGAVNPKLSLLTKGASTGVLHFVAKPLLAYTLENLHEVVNSTIFILGEKGVENPISKITPYLDWKTAQSCSTDLNYDLHEETLWLRDDIVYDLDFIELLASIRGSQQDYVAIFAEEIPVLFYKKNNVLTANESRTESSFLKLPFEFKQGMSNQDYCNALLKTFNWHKQSLDAGQAKVLDTPKKYHELSMTLLLGEYRHLVLDPHQNDKRLIKGWHIQVDELSLTQHHVYIGDCVNVHKQSQLHEKAIICQGSYIDKFVDITNSIVLPGVYVGPYLNLNNAIVTGNEVIRIDNDVIIPILDKRFTDAVFSYSEMRL
jgi:hypothetical protein